MPQVEHDCGPQHASPTTDHTGRAVAGLAGGRSRQSLMRLRRARGVRVVRLEVRVEELTRRGLLGEDPREDPAAVAAVAQQLLDAAVAAAPMKGRTVEAVDPERAAIAEMVAPAHDAAVASAERRHAPPVPDRAPATVSRAKAAPPRRPIGLPSGAGTDAAERRTVQERRFLPPAVQRAMPSSFLAKAQWGSEWGPTPDDPASWLDRELAADHAEEIAAVARWRRQRARSP